LTSFKEELLRPQEESQLMEDLQMQALTKETQVVLRKGHQLQAKIVWVIQLLLEQLMQDLQEIFQIIEHSKTIYNRKNIHHLAQR
jgi:hypothetical protein